MKIKLNRGNEYFDTYYIYDDKYNKIGIYENHCRNVKHQYFVGWKLDKPNGMTGETKTFDTKEEAINFSIGN